MNKALISFTRRLKEGLIAGSSPERSVKQKAYMKGQYDYYGIMAAERKEILKHAQFPKDTSLDEFIILSKNYWELPQREYQYVAMDLMPKFKKKLREDSIHWIEHLICAKSWWDTVDFLAVHMAGAYFLKFPSAIDTHINQWINSENMWLNRTAILFQLKYKEKTNVDLLFACIEAHIGSKEFFINKASGWALRELSKRDPATVVEFVESRPVSNLTKREGLKWINKGA